MSLVPAFEIGVWNAWIFMIWLLIQNIAVMANKELYRRAGQQSETKPGRLYKFLSLLSTPLWLLSTVYSIFLPLKLGTAWFIAGLIIFLAALAVLVIATFNFASGPADRPSTKGAYRFSRHPLYVALILVYFSVGIASASWVFLIIAAVWVFLFNIAAKDEELFCQEKFGPAYREYMNRTPRWVGVPRPSNGDKNSKNL